MAYQLPNTAESSEPKRVLADWESLSRLSKVPIMDVGYYGLVLVPLLALLVQFLNSYFSLSWAHMFLEAFHKHQFLHLFAIVFSKMKMHLGWSLILTYMAAVTLAFGKLIFSLACPRDILIHGSFIAYVKYLAEFAVSLETIATHHRSAVSFDVKQQLAKAMDGRSEEERNSIPEDLLSDVRERLADIARNPIENALTIQMTDLLHDYKNKWEQQNTRFWFWRYLTLGCFGLSAICAAIVFFVLAPMRVIAAAGF